MVLTLATTAAAGLSLSCLFSGSAAAATITAIHAAAAAVATATAIATTTAQTTALAAEAPVAEQNYPNKKIFLRTFRKSRSAISGSALFRFGGRKFLFNGNVQRHAPYRNIFVVRIWNLLLQRRTHININCPATLRELLPRSVPRCQVI